MEEEEESDVTMLNGSGVCWPQTLKSDVSAGWKPLVIHI